MITDELIEQENYLEYDLTFQGTITKNWKKTIYSPIGNAYDLTIRKWEHLIIPLDIYEGVIAVECRDNRVARTCFCAESIEVIERYFYDYIALFDGCD